MTPNIRAYIFCFFSYLCDFDIYVCWFLFPFHISKTLNSSKRGSNILFHIPDRKSSFVFVLVLIFVIVVIVVIVFVLAPPIRRMRTCLMTEQLSHTLSLSLWLRYNPSLIFTCWTTRSYHKPSCILSTMCFDDKILSGHITLSGDAAFSSAAILSRSRPAF